MTTDLFLSGRSASEPTPYFRVNASNSDFSPSDGSLDWLGGTSGTGFSTISFVTSSSSFTAYDNLPTYIDPTEAITIFSGEKFQSGTISNPNVTITLPNGMYKVRYYAGNSFGGTSGIGDRVFDIKYNGVVAHTSVDLVALFGHSVLGYLEYDITITTGSLIVQYNRIVEQPLFNAIEILTI